MAGKEIKNYTSILNSLKEKIRLGRYKAISKANTEMLMVYWEIGNTISAQIKTDDGGSIVVQKLATDLKGEFPGFTGLSVRNISYMRSFAEAYPDFIILQQAAAKNQTTENQSLIFLQLLVAKIPWTHNITLLDRVKDIQERYFYAQKTLENNWSKNAPIIAYRYHFNHA